MLIASLFNLKKVIKNNNSNKEKRARKNVQYVWTLAHKKYGCDQKPTFPLIQLSRSIILLMINKFIMLTMCLHGFVPAKWYTQGVVYQTKPGLTCNVNSLPDCLRPLLVNWTVLCNWWFKCNVLTSLNTKISILIYLSLICSEIVKCVYTMLKFCSVLQL